MQTGETEKLTGVFDGLRVDRLALASTPSRSIRTAATDGERPTSDGRPTSSRRAARGTGQIVCNVQRYNPTPAQLASCPAIQGRTKTTVDGVVPLASPIGLDNTISECVPFNIMGHGQITPAAADYITTPKWGISVVEQDFAELLFAASCRTAGARDRCRSRRASRTATSRSTTAPIPSRSMSWGRRSTRRTSAFAASPRRCQRAARTCISFPRCRRSRAATTSGRYSASSTCPSGNRSRGAGLGSSFAYRSSDYSSVGRFESWKVGLDFQIFRDLRLRATGSRDVREATFSERFDNSPTGGTVRSGPQGDASTTITLTTAGNPDCVRRWPTRPSSARLSAGLGRGPRMSVDRYESTSRTRSRRLARSESSTSASTSAFSASTCFATTRGVLSSRVQPVSQPRSRERERASTSRSATRGMWTSSTVATNHYRFACSAAARTRGPARSSAASPRSSRSQPCGFPDMTANLTVSYRVNQLDGPAAGALHRRGAVEPHWVEGVDVDDNTIPSRAWTNLVLGSRAKCATAPVGASRSTSRTCSTRIRRSSRRPATRDSERRRPTPPTTSWAALSARLQHGVLSGGGGDAALGDHRHPQPRCERSRARQSHGSRWRTRADPRAARAGRGSEREAARVPARAAVHHGIGLPLLGSTSRGKRPFCAPHSRAT